jgi:hypothetical protein
MELMRRISLIVPCLLKGIEVSVLIVLCSLIAVFFETGSWNLPVPLRFLIPCTPLALGLYYYVGCVGTKTSPPELLTYKLLRLIDFG